MYPKARKGGPARPPAGTQNFPIRAIDTSLVERLRHYAQEDDRSLNKFIIKVLREYVEQRESTGDHQP